jgi:hypothetical protein
MHELCAYEEETKTIAMGKMIFFLFRNASHHPSRSYRKATSKKYRPRCFLGMHENMAQDWNMQKKREKNSHKAQYIYATNIRGDKDSAMEK